MKTKYKLLTLVLCLSLSMSAQQKLNKLSESIKVTDEVTIDVNTSFVQIEIDTWNKNTLEVEAYIEGQKLSKEELEEALKNWDLTVEGSGDYVKISSQGSRGSWTNHSFNYNYNFDVLKDLEINLADLLELPQMPEMPEMPELVELHFPEMPELPELPELPEGIHNVHFDTEAYKKDGEKYLEKWSAEYETKYGAEYKEKMKTWAKKMAKVDFSSYEKNMEDWGKKFGDKFGEDFSKKMEVWGEKFGKQFEGEWASKMEVWGENFARQIEERTAHLEQRKRGLEHRQERMAEHQKAMEKRSEALAKRIENRNEKVKKTIKIKMPKDAKLKMNVRHGELKFSSIIHDLKADISHATLVANHIDGSETSINVSYSPVLISTWSLGELKLNYVEEAEIKTVNRLVLSANSSNTTIGNLKGNAIIDGSFGDLTIGNIAESFNNLNIILENSDALIILPKTNHNLQYKSNRSHLVHPGKNTKDDITNFSTGNLSSNKTIAVNAKFSNVVFKN